MQEGTLKKINKDRNEKTTRNVQQGLPFSIDDVKRQTEDSAVLQAVSIVNYFLLVDILLYHIFSLHLSRLSNGFVNN